MQVVPLEVQQAGLEDAGRVESVLGASYAELLKPAYDPKTLEQSLAYMSKANPKLLAAGRFFLAVEGDERAVGCGGWSWEHPVTGAVESGVGHIRHFATRADAIHRGIGRAIYGACERQARQQGVMQFDVFASVNAVGFYAALGFQRLEDFCFPLPNGALYPSVEMRRRLDQGSQ